MRWFFPGELFFGGLGRRPSPLYQSAHDLRRVLITRFEEMGIDHECRGGIRVSQATRNRAYRHARSDETGRGEMAQIV